VTILCYHAVDPGWQSPLSLPPSIFRRHCEWLARHRAIVDLGEAAGKTDARGRLPSGLCAITFDDGLGSVFEHALPALVHYGLPATVFLVAGTLGSRAQKVDWMDNGPRGFLPALTLGQIEEMAASGVRFGSHSYSHRDLTSLTEDECYQDLHDSKVLLEDVLGREVPLLAYPRGLHNEGVRRAARRAGFSHAFGTARRRPAPSRWGIPRMGVYTGDGELKLRIKSSRAYASARTGGTYNALRALTRR
jgi:peptidoglycan/xylan/chitin deacetylase (PgdA/CDA1 family)